MFKRNVKHHFKWKREMKFITMNNLFCYCFISKDCDNSDGLESFAKRNS